MADEIDLANDLIDNEVSRVLHKMRQENANSVLGSKFCAECGEEIPKARHKLGYKFCVVCASESERRKSLFVDF